MSLHLSVFTPKSLFLFLSTAALLNFKQNQVVLCTKNVSKNCAEDPNITDTARIHG